MQTFRLDHRKSVVLPLSLPNGELIQDILGRVLCLPSVASKRYLTNKVPLLYLHSFLAYHLSLLWISHAIWVVIASIISYIV